MLAFLVSSIRLGMAFLFGIENIVFYDALYVHFCYDCVVFYKGISYVILYDFPKWRNF